MAAAAPWPPVARSRRMPPPGPLWADVPRDWGWIAAGTTIVRHYTGHPPDLLLWYEADAANMARYRWRAISHDWVPDDWDPWAYQVALLLCLLGVGVLLLGYFALVKPPALLTVTYAHF